ncbi:MAG TPA: bifunctional phosphoribosylaminoimidazolecarboxamide formyltransferase/IMP cyclohydrolase, partial [Phycisphaerae bacterium]|nr:bifunctional phosphoribosylaminoimidazolecarboxamide formyltransferase/IMP cyclohydrolase [Phycisphaerae bacterium]
MPEHKIKRALIAVYDKTGIAEFARALVDEFGIEIISTGGTAKHLKEHGIPVTMVEEVTGFPEMLDGRVKTLHPKIHAGILADRDNPEHMRQLAEHGIKPIDMVVVNLYPFEKTVADPNCKFEDAIEMIDIGGPCMLRAAAKNHKHVLVVTGDPAFYSGTLSHLHQWRDPVHREDALSSGAFSAFWEISQYDASVARWLIRSQNKGSDQVDVLRLWKDEDLRYGENPHQKGQFFQLFGDPRLAKLICRVESSAPAMSFNNF